MSSHGDRAILITGGAGYIGAHVAKALSERGYLPVAFDNLSSGFGEAVRWGPLVQGDIRDAAALSAAIDRYQVRGVVHCAGLIEVGRSTQVPDIFWDINVNGTAVLLGAMRRGGVDRLVFSSSAAVYGDGSGGSSLAPLREEAPLLPTSPYGETKLACEWMIRADCKAYGLRAIALRYFNAAGADPSGEIGEAHEPETHLIPLALAAALDRDRPLTVFGDDFPTADGTCVRDYIHVSDLALAHISALETDLEPGRFEAVNVGCGEGRSVREVVTAAEKALGRPIPHRLGGRRDGDPAVLVANPERGRALLDWSPVRSSLEQILADATRWESAPRYGRGARARRSAGGES